jgi:hypothetical protein
MISGKGTIDSTNAFTGSWSTVTSSDLPSWTESHTQSGTNYDDEFAFSP